jgi:DNA polymerase-3 subunit alpha
MSVRNQNTSSGRMSVINFSDDSDTAEVMVFADVFDKHRQKLREDELLVLEVNVRLRGRPANGEFEGRGELRTSIRATNVLSLTEARTRFARGVRLTCNGASSGSRLRDVLAPYRSGTCPVSVVYSNRGVRCEIDLGEAWRVNLHEDLIRSLSEWLSPENVRVVYGEPRAGQ